MYKRQARIQPEALGMKEIVCGQHRGNKLSGDGCKSRARHAPVSYTHLDVYKRQVINRGRGGDILEKKERWTLAAVLPLIVLVMFLVWGIKPRTDDIRTAVSADGIWVLDDTELMQTAVPVSYTHLDVYKRQPL